MENLKTVLVIDGGGRGATLVHKYSQSKSVGKILAIPGNDLMQTNSKKPVKIYPHVKTTNLKEILRICKKEKVDLVDVAQDNAVESGLVNELKKIKIKALGPTKEAGQIEWDKAWARNFMQRHKIPQPSFKVFHSPKDGINYLKTKPDQPWFVKAFGLAEGKGALPAENNKEALERILEMKKFGKAGKTYLIEQWLKGEEFSLFVLSDGIHYQIAGGAQDHKRMFNFDQGENTGGIGCISPPLILTRELLKEIDEKIIKKTLLGLRREKRMYQGVLYLGGLVANGQVYVVEFNARWGDPEAQVVIPGIRNDFYGLGLAMINGRLDKIKIKKDNLTRVAVTMCLRPCPAGEPGENGRRIYGLEDVLKIKEVTVYGTRVKKINGKYYVGGGRLMHIVGRGKNIREARQKAYGAAAVLYIEGNNLHYRTDIGWRDLERKIENDH